MFFMFYNVQNTGGSELTVYYLHHYVSRIFNGVLRAAFLAIVHRDDPGTMIDHPLVSDLEARSAVVRTNIPNQVGLLHDTVIPPLPVGTPTPLESLKGTGADEPYRMTLGSKPENDFCRPDVHASSHTADKCSKTVSYGISDFLLKSGNDYRFRLRQLFRTMPREATSVPPHFLFGHSNHPNDE